MRRYDPHRTALKSELRVVLARVFQLVLFVWLMPICFRSTADFGVAGMRYSFDTRLVIAALLAGCIAYLVGMALGGLLKIFLG